MLGDLLVPADFLFPAAGILATVVALKRKAEQRQEVLAPAAVTEFLLTLIALLCVAVGPNILVVALTPGMPEMHLLTRYALIPSLVVLAAIGLISRWLGWRCLTNRLWTGMWVGAVTTGVLDAVRLTGFSLGLMPGNMPRMFGVLILNTMATGPTVGSDIIGYLYHYWVGACFGLTLTLLFGKVRWWAGPVWALVIEVGMMTTPPMVVAMDTGYFGFKSGSGLFITSLVAHVAYGVFLGVLIEKYTVHRGHVVQLGKAAFQALRSR